ncbi:hypothetical protein ABKA04_001628 [Annulohypoxylon sp. FPYF3050]
MPAAGLKTIIALSFVLAIGFLLVILSCALYKVYYPLLVVATYVLAPVPNWIATRCANPDDFVESTGNGVLDLGRFCTGFMVVMGIGKASPLLRRFNLSSPAMSYEGTSALRVQMQM